jgi:AAA+ superfamily predicted ATPase
VIEYLTYLFRYQGNLLRVRNSGSENEAPPSIACIIKGAHLLAPTLQGGLSYDLNALALLMRDWTSEEIFTSYPLATFLIADNLMDLNPILARNIHAREVEIPQPSQEEIHQFLKYLATTAPIVLQGRDTEQLSKQLVGTSLTSLRTLILTREHDQHPIDDKDLAQLKKELVEQDCDGLIEFIDSTRSLDDLQGQDYLKKSLRLDLKLWHDGDLTALPMGYLFCGPVGTGKTYSVECLAGEAGVPVVKLKNFRDRWIGSTEGNLEKIFRLLHSLGQCFVFIDEADQALGKRDSGDGDSGLSGRIYSMIAKEMSDTNNQGKIIWVLATSRPDLIEVDLKRPGRIDVKIPLFPTVTPEQSFDLIRYLCKRKGLDIPKGLFESLKPSLPDWLTPGGANAIALKVYRDSRSQGISPSDALSTSLRTYQSPISAAVMGHQIDLAMAEASDKQFIPKELMNRAPLPS